MSQGLGYGGWPGGRAADVRAIMLAEPFTQVGIGTPGVWSGIALPIATRLEVSFVDATLYLGAGKPFFFRANLFNTVPLGTPPVPKSLAVGFNPTGTAIWVDASAAYAANDVVALELCFTPAVAAEMEQFFP